MKIERTRNATRSISVGMILRLCGYNKRLFRRFMQEELRLDKTCSQKSYDHVIVGSNKVFNHAAGIRLQLHGDVKQACKVITYAASCGSVGRI